MPHCRHLGSLFLLTSIICILAQDKPKLKSRSRLVDIHCNCCSATRATYLTIRRCFQSRSPLLRVNPVAVLLFAISESIHVIGIGQTMIKLVRTWVIVALCGLSCV